MGKCGQSTISMAHFQVRKLLLEGTGTHPPASPHHFLRDDILTLLGNLASGIFIFGLLTMMFPAIREARIVDGAAIMI